VVESAFAALQRDKLAEAWRADLPNSTTPHVVIALPSYSLDRSVIEHYGDRVPPLENRYFYAILRARNPATRVVYLSSLPLPTAIAEGYLDLIPPADRPGVAWRSKVASPDDLSHRPLAEKILDRGDLIDTLRAFIGDEPALIEPWNVTEAEAALSVALGAPLHGSDPDARDLATKSNGRRLFRAAGVPVPLGVEDVRSPGDVAAAVASLARQRPGLREVVVKLDDSVAGDGNLVLSVEAVLAAPSAEALLPDWYVPVLQAGGVVEERIAGIDFRSPSAQATITPLGEVVPLATHEQRLGGADGQVYEGCTFPADPSYAALLSRYTAAAGRALAEAGARGRFAVDFVVCRRAEGGSDWDVYALEINLRKGGTTHPYGTMKAVLGGAYDAAAGQYRDRFGRPVYYGATDNLIDPAWVGRPICEVRDALARAGVDFDQAGGEGVIPHLLDCLEVDGRMGYTAVAHTPEKVVELEERTVAALARP
jgi:hypothetical protein